MKVIFLLFTLVLVDVGKNVLCFEAPRSRGLQSQGLRGETQRRHLAAVDPLFCDSVEAVEGGGYTCVVSSDQTWHNAEEIDITPLSVRLGNVDSPIVPSGTITGIHIQQDTLLYCAAYLCEFNIRGFQAIEIDGTVRGSKISLLSDGDISMGPAGWLDTLGRGYVSGQGPGAGHRPTNALACENIAGAGHGANGGARCGYGRRDLVYDEGAQDFGSGGYTVSCNIAYEVSHGGGIIVMSAEGAIVLAQGARVVADAGPDEFCIGYCAGGSGGSIRISAPAMRGSATISANGATGYIGGGGGRIIIRVDEIDRSNFLIQAKGGRLTSAREDSCPEGIGLDAIPVFTCRTTTCGIGGTLKGGDQCGCDCSLPWAGIDCTECTQTCLNGGVLDESTCTCICTNEWKGEQCTVCNEGFLCSGNGACAAAEEADAGSTTFQCRCDDNWFGSRCFNFCDRTVTCSSNGVCSPDGLSCDCDPGFAGQDCFCPAVPEEVCNAGGGCSGNGSCRDQVCLCRAGWTGCRCDVPCDCSGNGQCDNQGRCECNEGFAGEKCDIECDDCNGHGRCNPEDGTCLCDPGFTGSKCTQDPSTYCSSPSSTISGSPCLTEVLNVLGNSYDRRSGSIKGPLIQLQYTQGRTLTLPGGRTWELPDDVYCNVIPRSTLSFSTRAFDSTADLRKFYSSSVGITVGVEEADFSQSQEYNELIEKSFLQNRVLTMSDLRHPLYECTLIDRVDFPGIAADAINSYKGSSGDRRVQALGTHYITSAVFGGRITVINFVSLCVYSELSSFELQDEIDASVADLATSASASGSVSEVVGDECSVYTENSSYSTIVTGGDRARLIGSSDITNSQFLATVESRPGHIRLGLNPIEFLFPDMEDEVEAYTGGVTVEDTSIEDIKARIGDTIPPCRKTCAASPANFEEENNNSSRGGGGGGSNIGAIFGIIFPLLLVGAIVAGVWYCCKRNYRCEKEPRYV